MRWLLVTTILLVGCLTTRTPEPLTPSQVTASIVDLKAAVRMAGRFCTANAVRLDPTRGEALFDACVWALSPAWDGAYFASDAPSVGCAGRAVRVALESVRGLIEAAGGNGYPLVAGIGVGRRLEGYALPSCDPLHPTTSVRVFVDPNIAPVEPDYPR